MAENENETDTSTFSAFDKTSTGFPTEQWEKKLKENEKTAIMTQPPEPQHVGVATAYYVFSIGLLWCLFGNASRCSMQENARFCGRKSVVIYV